MMRPHRVQSKMIAKQFDNPKEQINEHLRGRAPQGSTNSVGYPREGNHLRGRRGGAPCDPFAPSAIRDILLWAHVISVNAHFLVVESLLSSPEHRPGLDEARNHLNLLPRYSCVPSGSADTPTTVCSLSLGGIFNGNKLTYATWGWHRMYQNCRAYWR
jgi:hypothetical protein